jgi:hypothetical protein
LWVGLFGGMYRGLWNGALFRPRDSGAFSSVILAEAGIHGYAMVSGAKFW